MRNPWNRASPVIRSTEVGPEDPLSPHSAQLPGTESLVCGQEGVVDPDELAGSVPATIASVATTVRGFSKWDANRSRKVGRLPGQEEKQIGAWVIPGWGFRR